jgi:hypothetical protein
MLGERSNKSVLHSEGVGKMIFPNFAVWKVRKVPTNGCNIGLGWSNLSKV